MVFEAMSLNVVIKGVRVDKRIGPMTELWNTPTLGGQRKEGEPAKKIEKK